MKILIVQTSFLGDVILTLPLVAEAKKFFSASLVDVVVIPAAKNLLDNNPNISEIIIFDKRGKDSGVSGLFRLANILKHKKYDIALVPHRSLRSAVLTRFAKIPRRIGYNTSSGSALFTECVAYNKTIHEIERNLKFLQPFGFQTDCKILPDLYPSENDRKIVDDFFNQNGLASKEKTIAIAPGAVWNTKRWLKENFISLAHGLIREGNTIILIGGKADELICEEIKKAVVSKNLLNSAGKFSLLQSAEIIRRSKLLVSNDSAPMHIAVAMQTPVIAIFGATIPGFGFYPYGENDAIVEIHNLQCRPCGIHGGKTCPVKTFDCMDEITPEMVLAKVQELLSLHSL